MATDIFDNDRVTVTKLCGPGGRPMIQITNEKLDFVQITLQDFIDITAKTDLVDLILAQHRYKHKTEGAKNDGK